MGTDSLEQLARELVEHHSSKALDPKTKRRSATLAARLAVALEGVVQDSVARAVGARLEPAPVHAPVATASERSGPGVGIASAVNAGGRFRDAVWGSNEMLTSGAAGKQLNMSREALNKQRHAGKLLGLEAAKRGVRYPKWQFEDGVRPHVPALLSELSHLDPWGQYLFFTRDEPLLKGIAPLESLRRGNATQVLQVARQLAEDAAGGPEFVGEQPSSVRHMSSPSGPLSKGLKTGSSSTKRANPRVAARRKG